MTSFPDRSQHLLKKIFKSFDSPPVSAMLYATPVGCLDFDNQECRNEKLCAPKRDMNVSWDEQYDRCHFHTRNLPNHAEKVNITCANAARQNGLSDWCCNRALLVIVPE